MYYTTHKITLQYQKALPSIQEAKHCPHFVAYTISDKN